MEMDEIAQKYLADLDQQEKEALERIKNDIAARKETVQRECTVIVENTRMSIISLEKTREEKLKNIHEYYDRKIAEAKEEGRLRLEKRFSHPTDVIDLTENEGNVAVSSQQEANPPSLSKQVRDARKRAELVKERDADEYAWMDGEEVSSESEDYELDPACDRLVPSDFFQPVVADADQLYHFLSQLVKDAARIAEAKKDTYTLEAEKNTWYATNFRYVIDDIIGCLDAKHSAGLSDKLHRLTVKTFQYGPPVYHVQTCFLTNAPCYVCGRPSKYSREVSLVGQPDPVYVGRKCERVFFTILDFMAVLSEAALELDTTPLPDLMKDLCAAREKMIHSHVSRINNLKSERNYYTRKRRKL